jgi:hypothetical protein
MFVSNGTVDPMPRCHWTFAGQTILNFRNADRIEAGLHRCRSVFVSDEPRERGDRRIPKFVIDVCRYVEQLPNLAGLEGDLDSWDRGSPD